MRSKHDFPSLNAKQPDGLRPDGTPYKVLVVEPNEFQRKQIVQILVSESYDVIATAKDGQEAVEILDRIAGQVDFVTTDLDMPRLDGYALLFQIKDKGYNVLTAFISNETTKGVLQDLLQMGAADFILKPYSRFRLLERIKMLTQKLQ